MGGKSSKRRYSSSSPRHQQNAYYNTPQHNSQQLQRKLSRKYSKIADNYKTLDQVTAALAEAGLESSNLIVGIDFTKSNEWTGSKSYKRRSLHHIGNSTQNPYEQAISIIGKTLSGFDDDNLIPCFGFGDASTHDQEVFSFYPEDVPCDGFEQVLTQYRQIVPNLKLSGPTSFAPVIEMGMTIVEESGGQYHVLLIIADGQVTRSADAKRGHLSPQEQNTIHAIVRASAYPLSIVLVGVGDGPWDMMRQFDDDIPARAFDNFQFVNFTEIMAKSFSPSRKQTEFALAALMEIPFQYKATIELGLLGRRTGHSPQKVPLPPPLHGAAPFNADGPTPPCSSPYQISAPPYPGHQAESSAASSSRLAIYDNQACPICLINPKNMAFGCGHQSCCGCGENLQACPICRNSIIARIRLY